MTFRITQAVPISERLLIAIAGPQASGKTTSALRLATGITKVTGGKITVIDTERRRALTYAKNFKFFHLELDAPYGPDRYDEAIEAAEKGGYANAGDVIIIDSMSHEHDGPGGVLELHEKFLDKKAGDDYKKRDKLNMLGWQHAKKGRKRMIHYRLAQTNAHVILCFRAKDKVVMEKNSEGKTEVINKGLEAIGGHEYFFEMQIALMLPQGAAGRPDWKQPESRINEFGEGPIKRLLMQEGLQINEEVGQRLAEIGAVPPEPKQENPLKPLYDPILKAMGEANTEASLYRVVNETYKVSMDEIQSKNQATYDGIMAKYNDKMTRLQKELDAGDAEE